MARTTIESMTRIEGHLRTDVEIEGGKVRAKKRRRLPDIFICPKGEGRATS